MLQLFKRKYVLKAPHRRDSQSDNEVLAPEARGSWTLVMNKYWPLRVLDSLTGDSKIDIFLKKIDFLPKNTFFLISEPGLAQMLY